MKKIVAALALAAVSATSAGPLAAKIAAKYKVTKNDVWYGGERTVFDFQGYAAWVVEPPAGVAPQAGNPWTWTMQWKDAFVPRTSVPRLLRAGYHHVTVDTFQERMNEKGLKVSKDFQSFLVNELGLAPKARLIGMSWGGFFSIRYATTYPENVEKIYLDAPLLNFNSFGKDPSRIRPWRMPAEGWATSPEMPVNRAGMMAENGIPMLLLYGGADTVVTPEDNCELFAKNYAAAGGSNLRMVKRGMYAHHPHGVEVDEDTIIDFFTSPVTPRADVLRSTLDAAVRSGRIAGVVSVLSDDGCSERYDCVGWAEIGKRRMTPDTVFAVFSMSKTFLGAAMMCAIDEGKIALDDPVSTYLPEFADVRMKDGSKPKRPLTVRDLTSHVNGFRGGYPLVNRDISQREVARRLAATPLHTQPGETFSYGTATIDSAAACLEVAVGKPYEIYLKEKILDPLGMKDTTFTPNAEQVARLVKAYTTDDGKARPANDACVPQIVFPKVKPVQPAAGGGLFSTPRDMVRFSQMLAHHGEWKGKRLISRQTFDTVFAVKQTPPSVSAPYTCGSWLYGDWFGHEGAMRTDQRANLKTGQCRLFFIQTDNKAGSAFFKLKRDWHAACDKIQGTPPTMFGN